MTEGDFHSFFLSDVTISNIKDILATIFKCDTPSIWTTSRLKIIIIIIIITKLWEFSNARTTFNNKRVSKWLECDPWYNTLIFKVHFMLRIFYFWNLNRQLYYHLIFKYFLLQTQSKFLIVDYNIYDTFYNIAIRGF